MKKLSAKRIVIYCIGILILACGITMNTKTGLGVSPVISVPYNITQVLGLPLGLPVFVYYAFLIFLQYVLLPKEFSFTKFLQIICAFLTSACVQVFDIILPSPDAWVLRIPMLVIAILLTGLGMCITVGMDLVPNPADGLASVIGKIMGKDMALGKNILDAVSIIVAIIIGLVFRGSLMGIGIGTVVAVIFTGRTVALFRRPTAKLIDYVNRS